jgi:hypothetical protein
MTNSVRKATITSIGSCTIILALACVSMPGCIKPEEPMPNYGKGARVNEGGRGDCAMDVLF